MKYKQKEDFLMPKLFLATVRKKLYCWRWFEFGDYCPINPDKNTKNEICVHLSDDYEYLVDKSYFFEKPDSYFKNVFLTTIEFKNLIETDYKNLNDIVKKYDNFMFMQKTNFQENKNAILMYDFLKNNF